MAALKYLHVHAGDAEIVSIDAFIRKSEKTEGIVVGISLILLKVRHVQCKTDCRECHCRFGVKLTMEIASM